MTQRVAYAQMGHLLSRLGGHRIHVRVIATALAASMEKPLGSFYAVTFNGGSSLGDGVIFKVDQQGNVSVIYTFPNSTKYGQFPVGLVEGTDGYFYGATQAGGRYQQGVLFRFSPSSGVVVLDSFNSKGGSFPLAPPVQHTNGLFYGTTPTGGKFNAGEVYSLNVGLAPFIAFVRPNGSVGGTAQILGQGLNGTTGVTFNGVPATSFTVMADTFMTAVVPSGATTGPVVVTTSTGTLTSNKNFAVLK